MTALLTLTTLLLAALTSLAIDRSTRRRGLDPPGFRLPPDEPPGLRLGPLLRRSLALTVVAGVLWLGVFGPLAMAGRAVEPDFARLEPAQLFLLHGLLVASLAVWYLLGRGAPGARSSGPGGFHWWSQFGFATPRPLGEIALGLGAGLASWLAVLAVLLAAAVGVWALGGERFLEGEPPRLIFWIAALPVSTRLLVSLSAGLVEEAFFRGFLQPRIGILGSTALFVLAHASYEQPLMLVGITLLSLVFAYLVRWRQTIWPAVAAHAVFDAVQLLVVIPTVLRFVPDGGRPGFEASELAAAIEAAARVW